MKQPSCADQKYIGRSWYCIRVVNLSALAWKGTRLRIDTKLSHQAVIVMCSFRYLDRTEDQTTRQTPEVMAAYYIFCHHNNNGADHPMYLSKAPADGDLV